MNKKCCILIPYYGQWPSYFNLFLDSCKNNLWLDIIFISDLKAQETVKNVHFHHSTKEDIKKRIQDNFGVEASIDRSYKLCDIRPAYGMIFSDIIQEYDFWGWGDIDLVYGNLDRFISDEDLKEVDIISGRELWVSGAFCLIRNSETMNQLFMVNDDYLDVFQSEAHTSFGECGKRWQDLVNGQSIFEIDFKQSNYTLIVKEAEQQRKIKTKFQNLHRESIGRSNFLRMVDGTLTDEGKQELFLFHYITDKKKGLFRYPDWDNVPKEYYITRTGFYTKEQFESSLFLTKETFRKWGRSLHFFLLRAKKKIEVSKD
jgi:hypothetical protein